MEKMILDDAKAAPVLRMISEHGLLTYPRIAEHAGDPGDSDEAFIALWRYIVSKQWVEEALGGWQLSVKGISWLGDEGGELSIEDEDQSSYETPIRPYEVSKLKMETKHLSVFQALRKIEKHEIDLNPEFQRAFVWDDIRKSRLIESILIRIPLPAFYLDATDQVHWSVVDGLQRLTTLYQYCRGDSFPLIGLQFLVELEGRRFAQLPAQFRVMIEDDTQLLFYNLTPGTPLEAKFTIFSRVNTGGMQLTPQEIRHALSQGKSTGLLKSLASNPTFLSVTEGVVESKRMSDRELILRGLAFTSLGYNAYRQFNELDAFLLHAMSHINSLSDGEVRRLELDFVTSLSKVYAIFGRYSFRKFSQRGGRRSPLNRALFEVWVTAVGKYPRKLLEDNRDPIIDAFLSLLVSR